MRKLLLLILALTAALTAMPQSMKMVVDSAGNVVGRWVRTNDDSYTVGVQDIYDVPKAGNRIVTFRAKNGRGVLWCRHLGRVKVYDAPSAKGKVIGEMVYDEGLVPETYPCLGKKKGWFKVAINGKAGFVKASQVQWDGMDTF